MKKYTALLALIILASCVTTDPENRISEEERIKKEQEQSIQRDMRHNTCVSRGHAVGSPRYKLCMKVKY